MSDNANQGYRGLDFQYFEIKRIAVHLLQTTFRNRQSFSAL